MENNLKCFVIIGYGKKTSFSNGKARVLDLDQTYSLLIKPVFDDLKIDCYRAIDKNLNGSIDKVMLDEIKNADIVIVDISTLNANVMWELGVRHSLKSHHTVIICEKEQMSFLPFDINHFVIHEYTHSEEGIPYLEVERFRGYLKKIVVGLLEKEKTTTDSPVFTFLGTNSDKKESEDTPESLTTEESFASVMQKAEEAKNSKDYKKALDLLAIAKKGAMQNMTLKDNLAFIISRQALCTYKLKEPNELEAFVKAKTILDELHPEQSQDTEVLGLSGAIQKRLFEITAKQEYLDNAIRFYEKGFQLKQDYYNGINTAFMLYQKTCILKQANKPWGDTKLKADYIRNCVLEISLLKEQQEKFTESNDAVWVLFTIAEAYHYKNDAAQQVAYEQAATALAKSRGEDFAIDSYKEQKEKIELILKKLNGYGE